MVDIMDMEDIFNEILNKYFVDHINYNRSIVKKLIKEVSDFVEAQQTIKCANCDERNEESFDETRRIMTEDRD